MKRAGRVLAISLACASAAFRRSAPPAPVGEFIRRRPRHGEPITERTDVRFLYDNDTRDTAIGQLRGRAFIVKLASLFNF